LNTSIDTIGMGDPEKEINNKDYGNKGYKNG
jgi:hypothetical protein